MAGPAAAGPAASRNSAISPATSRAAAKDEVAVKALRLALALAALGATTCAHADVGLDIYGVSYHFNGDKARELGIDNKFNPGLGVRLRARRESWDWIADAGFYHDSGRHTALVGGGGALWHAGERFRVGAAAVVFQSDTYNHGKAFLTPLPLAAYDLGRVTLNAFFSPKLREVNDINTLGLWATIWLR